MECTNPSAVVPLVYCRIRTILHIYPRRSVPKPDCQQKRRSTAYLLLRAKRLLTALLNYKELDKDEQYAITTTIAPLVSSNSS